MNRNGGLPAVTFDRNINTVCTKFGLKEFFDKDVVKYGEFLEQISMDPCAFEENEEQPTNDELIASAAARLQPHKRTHENKYQLLKWKINETLEDVDRQINVTKKLLIYSEWNAKSLRDMKVEVESLQLEENKKELKRLQWEENKEELENVQLEENEELNRL